MPPVSLTNIVTGLEVVHDRLSFFTDMQEQQKKLKQEMGQNQGQGKEDGGKEKGGKEEGGGSQEQKGQEGSNQGPSGEKQMVFNEQEELNKIKGELHQIHTYWYELEVELEEKGIEKNILQEFGHELNSLSSAVNQKNMQKAFEHHSRAYSYIPEFFSKFKTNYPAVEIEGFKYYIFKILSKGRNNQWNEMEKEINEMREVAKKIQEKMDEEDKQMNRIYKKLFLGINNLEDATKIKDEKVLELNGEILLDTVVEVKRMFEIKKKQGENK